LINSADTIKTEMRLAEQFKHVSDGLAIGGMSNESISKMGVLASSTQDVAEQQKKDRKALADAISNMAIDRQIDEYNRQAEEYADLAKRHGEQADFWKREQEHLKEQLGDLTDIETGLKTGNLSLEEAQKRLKKNGVDTEGMSMAEILLALDKRQEAIKDGISDAAGQEKQERDLAGEAREKSRIAKDAAKELEDFKRDHPNATPEEIEAKKAEVEQSVSEQHSSAAQSKSQNQDLAVKAEDIMQQDKGQITVVEAEQTNNELDNMFSMSPS